MTSTDGYEADPREVAALVEREVDAEDRSDPTMLYVRASALHAHHTAVAREMTKLRAQAVLRLSQQGMSYEAIAAHLKISKPRVQQLVNLARAELVEPARHDG